MTDPATVTSLPADPDELRAKAQILVSGRTFRTLWDAGLEGMELIHEVRRLTNGSSPFGQAELPFASAT